MPAPLLLLQTVLLGAPLFTRADNLIVLLDAGSRPNCTLADADLVRADLSDPNLNASDLRRANLSRARLDGADLRNADLRFSNLKGASLRRSDLRGAWLDGTDLRQADLRGALINPGASDLRWPQAERPFGEAIQADPEQAMSWVARGLSRGQQGDEAKAAQDQLHAADLLDRQARLNAVS